MILYANSNFAKYIRVGDNPNVEFVMEKIMVNFELDEKKAEENEEAVFCVGDEMLHEGNVIENVDDDYEEKEGSEEEPDEATLRQMDADIIDDEDENSFIYVCALRNLIAGEELISTSSNRT